MSLISFYSHHCSLQSTVESMEQQLGVQPVLTQLPVGDGRDFQGVVDLLHMHALMWPQETEGTSYFRVLLENLPQDTQKLAHHYREQLLEQVRNAGLDFTLGDPCKACAGGNGG